MGGLDHNKERKRQRFYGCLKLFLPFLKIIIFLAVLGLSCCMRELRFESQTLESSGLSS